MSLTTARIDFEAFAQLSALEEPISGPGGRFVRYGAIGGGSLSGCIHAYFGLPDSERSRARISQYGAVEGREGILFADDIETIARRPDFPPAHA